MDELDVAKRMVNGELPPLIMYENHLLSAIRVTGTGVAIEGNKAIYRKPCYYLHDDFLAACNGVPIIFQHPESTDFLNPDEYKKRNIGSSFYPYIKDSEVWTIARIYDEDAIKGFVHGIFKDTSPGIAVIKSEEISLRTGEVLHVEGKPICINHIAIVPIGVWSLSLTNPTGIPNMDTQNLTEDENDNAPGSRKPVSTENSVQEQSPEQLFLAKMQQLSTGFDVVLNKIEAIGNKIQDMDARLGGLEQKSSDFGDDVIEKKIEAIEANLPSQITDNERLELADIIEKTNHAARMINKTVKHIPSDTLKSFVARSLTELKEFSPIYKDTPVSEMMAGNTIMKTCHAQVLKDVMAYSMLPSSLPEDGHVDKIKQIEPSGRVTYQWRTNMFKLFKNHAG